MDEFVLKTKDGKTVWEAASPELAAYAKRWFCERGCYVSIVNKYA